MTIKDNIELVNKTINESYINLQNLVYEEEIERYVRKKLLDITYIAREILEYTHNQEVKQRQGKNRIQKRKVK